MAVPNTVQRPLVAVAPGAALYLHSCTISCAGRDRDLVHASGPAAALHARHCSMHGGQTCVVSSRGAALRLECCSLGGYSGAGVVATASPAGLVGTRLQGGPDAVVGVEAVAGAAVQLLGCSLGGHASNVEVRVCVCFVGGGAVLPVLV